MTIIDRFEGDIAVLETDSGISEISRDLLPENAREGDVIVNSEGEWFVDSDTTEERRKHMQEIMKRLMKND